jgi:NADP-dependent 3-hydroxy acid dehydrogenase YdfG
MSDLKGKVAVVTGASKGIGAAIAKGLSAAGAAVVVNYSSSKEGADRVVADIKSKGGKAVAIKGDVAKTADVRRLFEETKKAFDKLDVLVNNAGVYKFLLLEEITEDEFHREFNINVLGTILATKEAVKHFGSKGGSVINISSIASAGEAQAAIYSGTKGACRCDNTRARCGVGSAQNPGQRYCAGRRRNRGHAQRRHQGQRFREGDDCRHAAWSHRTAGRYCPRRRLPRVRGCRVAHRRAAYGLRRLPVTLGCRLRPSDCSELGHSAETAASRDMSPVGPKTSGNQCAPAELGRYIETEIETYRQIVAEYGIKTQ